MIKLLFNEDSDATVVGKIVLNGTFFSAEVHDPTFGYSGSDVIEELGAYHSYVFCRKPNSKVKSFRTIHRSDYKFLSMNRIGTAIRMDYTDMIQLYTEADVLQIDTGIISGGERDLIIRIFEGRAENFEIEMDGAYEVGSFSSESLPMLQHPRMMLWDSYSLSCGEVTFQADRKGMILLGDPSVPLILPKRKDYFEFTIEKYKGSFETPLTRDIDNEEVFVDSSCGLVNSRRVRLVNGKGTFRLYPFSHTGECKIKLGRKWYEVWNEYNLRIGE
ncbi:hypothetical protein [Phascolarctobacterium faecium]|jgi:hypothetical protein|uniref:hypothetical protein n=1 Tax=Phascolarctobacterium faecium TaxID=33025 RepID=UPI0020618C26|nr:hypothetical protein [Phascolarctobacterium faecium]DAL51546.1 MAG TPA_asm: hypothetical protein [Caudoviricetes sp.]